MEPNLNQAIQDFRHPVSVRLHGVAIVAGLHVNVNAGQDVSQLVNANGHIDRSGWVDVGAAKLLLACFTLNDVACSMEHVQDVIGLDLGFLLVSKRASYATSNSASNPTREDLTTSNAHAARPWVIDKASPPGAFMA